ncbi:MAG: peptidoglycan-binding protein [Candidatus Sericytochromatia bacterium]|nr:peptidoglycan-binding protein [Candidatus Sericytochromatia bacterium]
MTTSKKKAAPRAGEKSKRPTTKSAGRPTKAAAEAPVATVEPVEATPVVTAVTFAAPAETLAAPAPASTEAARPLMVYEFQQRLAERGYYPGVIDGDYGHHTRMAVARCQQAYGLPVDGEPTPDTLRALGF